MLYMMAQIDHSYQPVVADSYSKIGSRRHLCTCLPAGLGVFPQIADSDPFPGSGTIPQAMTARKLIIIVLIGFQNLVLESLKFVRLLFVCLHKIDQICFRCCCFYRSEAVYSDNTIAVCFRHLL